MANATTPTATPDPAAAAAGLPPFGDLAAAASDPTVDPCDVACAAMPGYVIGDLVPRDQRWLVDHTGDCRSCSSTLRGYKRIDHMLDRLDRYICDDPPPPPLFLADTRPVGYAQLESPLGPLFVAASDQGLCEIGFGAHENEGVFQGHLHARGFRPILDWNAVAGVASQLTEYFRGERNRFEVPLDVSGVTPFTRAVLGATADVPFGRLSTYRQVAEQIGQPKATRAVGNALGRNPIPIVIPCHRIVRSDSSLGGYTGGVQIKEHLLSLEGVLLR